MKTEKGVTLVTVILLPLDVRKSTVSVESIVKQSVSKRRNQDRLHSKLAKRVLCIGGVCGDRAAVTNVELTTC